MEMGLSWEGGRKEGARKGARGEGGKGRAKGGGREGEIGGKGRKSGEGVEKMAGNLKNGGKFESASSMRVLVSLNWGMRVNFWI